MMRGLSIIIFLLILINTTDAKVGPRKNSNTLRNKLLAEYSINYSSKNKLKELKNKTMKLHSKAVPALIEVMKNAKYPEKNRWVATFLLGRIMGKKSSAFVAKFLKHPSWVMRMASLKTLLSLKDIRFEEQMGKSLNDSSLLVRSQALDNISKLNLIKQAPKVWAMLYDKRNYYSPSKKKKIKAIRRTNLIRKVVKTIGDLKFKKAIKPLFSMIQNKKYTDIFKEINYSLERITNKKAPKGSSLLKRRFWSKVSLAERTF